METPSDTKPSQPANAELMHPAAIILIDPDQPACRPTRCACMTTGEYWGRCPTCGKWSGND